MKERRKWCKPRFKFNSDRNHEFSDLESEGSATSSASSKRHNHDSGNSSESSLEHSDSCTFSSDASPNDSDAIQVSPAEEISCKHKHIVTLLISAFDVYICAREIQTFTI